MAIDYGKVNELHAYLEALTDGRAAVDAGANPPADPAPLDVSAWKTSWKNKVVAGSGYKQAFFGSLSTPPTVTAANLQALGETAAAAAQIIAERDAIRAAALALIS